MPSVTLGGSPGRGGRSSVWVAGVVVIGFVVAVVVGCVVGADVVVVSLPTVQPPETRATSPTKSAAARPIAISRQRIRVIFIDSQIGLRAAARGGVDDRAVIGTSPRHKRSNAYVPMGAGRHWCGMGLPELANRCLKTALLGYKLACRAFVVPVGPLCLGELASDFA